MSSRPRPVVQFDAASGAYVVKGKKWPVASRYTVHECIGGGSYGDVCRATDNETGETVALKRIADVLCCPMLAKRVLREVCIMRRLSHPFVIRLADVFTRKLDDGTLDLYIATEFASGGDMYRLREALSESDVRLLIWQLLEATRYLHSCHVWHRDIKSENTLLLKDRTVKICDFGLSRSALGATSVAEPRKVQLSVNGSDARKSPRQLQRQYTKMVVTPSYRAPEVIMSRGQYTSAIDMWSIGCIFWELLMRLMNPQRLGPPPRPLFGVRGEPATPEVGELYVDAGGSQLADQLNVIFDVIGTPCWKDIESVPGDAWREYLKKLPGRAGNLGTQMAQCNREAVDLLTRMLAFDPSRRCTAQEALAHTYFHVLQKPLSEQARATPPRSTRGQAGGEGSGAAQDEDEVRPVTLPPDQHFWQVTDPAVALGLLERELEQSTHDPDGGKAKLEWLLEREAEGQQLQNYLRNSLMRNLASSRHASPSAVVSKFLSEAGALDPSTFSLDHAPGASMADSDLQSSGASQAALLAPGLGQTQHQQAVPGQQAELAAGQTHQQDLVQRQKLQRQRQQQREQQALQQQQQQMQQHVLAQQHALRQQEQPQLHAMQPAQHAHHLAPQQMEAQEDFLDVRSQLPGHHLPLGLAADVAPAVDRLVSQHQHTAAQLVQIQAPSAKLQTREPVGGNVPHASDQVLPLVQAGIAQAGAGAGPAAPGARDLQMRLGQALSEMRAQGSLGQVPGLRGQEGGAPSAAALVAATLAQAELKSRNSSIQALVANLRKRQRGASHKGGAPQGVAKAEGGGLQQTALANRPSTGGGVGGGDMGSLADAAVMAVDGRGQAQALARNVSFQDGSNVFYLRRSPRLREQVQSGDGPPRKRVAL